MHFRGLRNRRQIERSKNLFEEMMAENFPNLNKEKDIQVQEAQKVPNGINPKRPTPTYHN